MDGFVAKEVSVLLLSISCFAVIYLVAVNVGPSSLIAIDYPSQKSNIANSYPAPTSSLPLSSCFASLVKFVLLTDFPYYE